MRPSVLSRGRDSAHVSWAFLRMGWIGAASYPLSLAQILVTAIVPALIYFYVGQLVGHKPSVSGDYYSFLMVALLATRMTAGGLQDVSQQLEESINLGQLETLLVEPVSWRLLPFALAEWPLLFRLFTVGVVGTLSVALGAEYRAAGLPLATLIVLLGLGATLGIGLLGASIKVLAKRADPVLTVYMLVSVVLAGVYFPRELLPTPLRALSLAFPDTYVVSGVRKAAMVGGSGLAGPSPTTCIVALVTFNLLIHPIARWLLGRSLECGRRTGILASY